MDEISKTLFGLLSGYFVDWSVLDKSLFRIGLCSSKYGSYEVSNQDVAGNLVLLLLFTCGIRQEICAHCCATVFRMTQVAARKLRVLPHRAQHTLFCLKN